MTRTLAITQNITLDGVIDGTEGWFLPADGEHVDESDVLAALREQSAASDAFLAGRVTFEEMRGFWPLQTDDTTGVTAHLNQVAKYVVTSTMTDPQWQNSVVLSGPIADEVRALKAQPGRDIVVTGSIRLTHELIRLGLVDEFRLFVHPVILGHGRRLFEDAASGPRLRLTGTQAFRSGVVLSIYRTDPA